MVKQKTEKAGGGRIGLFISLLFLALIYLYYPQIHNYSTTPKWLFLGSFGILALFFGNKKAIPWSTGLSIWFLFVLNYLILCYWSYNFWDSVVRAIPLILSPLVVLVIAKEEIEYRVLYGKIALVTAVLILPLLVYTLIQIGALYSSGEYTHHSTYQFRFAFGNRNQFVQFLTLLVPLVFLGITQAQEKWKKYLFFILIALIYCTSVLLMNRTVFIVLFGLYPFGAIFYLISGKGKRFKRYTNVTIIAFIIVSGIVVLSPLRKQIPLVSNLTETSYGSGSERVQIWKNSIEIWKEDMLIGKGSGDWKIEILRTELDQTKAEYSKVFYQRAHNDFIQVAVENGLIGLILFIAFFVVGTINLFRSSTDPPIKLVLFFGVLAFIVIANFSFPLEKVELLILLFIFLLPGFSKRDTKAERGKVEKIGVAMILGITTLLAGIWLKNERLYFDYKSGNKLQLSEIDKTFYTIDPMSTPLFWYEGNKLYEKGNFAEALPEYEKALKYNPNHVHAINNLGSCYYSAGDIDYAEEQYQKALRVNPRFVETLMNYTSLLFNRGDINEALDNLLEVPSDQEPENYKMFIEVVCKAKFERLTEMYDEPRFENFLIHNYDNTELMYQVSLSSRHRGHDIYEDELRTFFKKQEGIPFVH